MRRTSFSALMPTGLVLFVGLLFLSGPAGACPELQGALAAAGQQPFPDPEPHFIPGRIEAEDYDVGGQGVAYHDATLGNEGGEYRHDDVGIERTPDLEGGYNVGWTEEGEWLAYTVDVASTGPYDIQVRVASAMDKAVIEAMPVVGTVSWTVPLTRTLHIEIDGKDMSGPVTFVANGSWQDWMSVFARRIELTEGRHVMRVVMDSGGINLNWVSFATSRPPGESPEGFLDWLSANMTLAEKIDQLHGIDWMDTVDNVRLGIPGFGMADGGHGLRGGPASSFPVGIALAATWDPDLVEQVGTAIGEELRGTSRHMLLAPCIDICRDPRNGRSPESGGEDPLLIGKIGLAFTRGVQMTQAIATPKHLVATNHQQDRRGADHRIDARTLRELYGLPFRMAVQQGGAWAIMNAYNWINGQPSSANRELLTTILRDEWGFAYSVVSDWGSVYTEAPEALKAGCDLEMPHVPGKYATELEDAIVSGEVTIAKLDQAVRRVLRTKLAAGLFGDYAPGNPDDVCSQEHRDLALEAAQKSLVLLKNEGNILPLDRSQLDSIALIGPSADVAQLDGIGSSVVEPCYAYTPKQGIENRAPSITINYTQGCDINSADTNGFPAALEAARNSDVVIFVGGLDGTQEGEERDRASGSVQLPGQQQALINELAAVNPNIIVVMESGGIVALEQCIDNIKGLIYAFYPGQEGGNAIADALFGNANPGGKLPVTMPRSDAQLPAWDDLDFSNDLVDGFGYRRFDSLRLTPRYAFGFGLSYTTFEYNDLTVTHTTAKGGPEIIVSVDVTNTGDRTGDEVVQLYLSTEFSDQKTRALVPMPVKQLRGFERVTLVPGQTKPVTFVLGPEELSFWSISDDSFRVEAGAYAVRVGGSSDDLPLSESIELTSSFLYDSAAGKTIRASRPVLANVALNRPSACSSIEGPGYSCHHAVDGDLSTRWSSQFTDQQWFSVDLGRRQRIERVVLHWERAYAAGYRIQVSDDGTGWTNVYSTVAGDGQVDNLDVTGSGRYLRLLTTQRATGWGNSVWELEVYARPELKPKSYPDSVVDFQPQPYECTTAYHGNRLEGVRGAINDRIRIVQRQATTQSPWAVVQIKSENR